MGLLLHRKAYLGGGGDASDTDYEFNHDEDEDDDDNALCFMKVPSNCGQPIPQL